MRPTGRRWPDAFPFSGTHREGTAVSLWVSESFESYPPHGFGWSVELKDDRGFEFSQSGGALSFWGAKRKARRAVKEGRKLYRRVSSSGTGGDR